MKIHNENAIRIAEFLEGHPKIKKVTYPGLPSHPHHELALRQSRGFGGMISFEVKGNVDDAKRFMEKLELFAIAESLGGVESLIELPAVMTHSSLSAAAREKIGITDTFIRMSVGIEDVDDLITDLKKALD